MAGESKRGSKSETLTIRLDPKTRFVLDFLARLKGQNITTVVERAIVTAASQENVADPRHPSQPDSWQEFWDVSEGVRALKIASRSEFYPTFEEERRLVFTREHWPFFYANAYKEVFLNHYIDVLWPRIDEFVLLHEDSKTRDYFAAGRAMQIALRSAKLAAPDWPIASLEEDLPF